MQKNPDKKTIKYWIITIGFRLLSLFPLWLLFLLAELITFVVYHLIGYRRKVVLQNLQNSFPEKEKDEIRWLCRKYYRHVSVMIVENIYLRFMSQKQIERRLIIENKELLESLFKQNKSVILLLGHFGNWEFGNGLSQLLPYKIGAVYKKLKSPAFNQIYFDIRSRFGVEPVEMKDVLRKIVTLKKASQPFLFYMVADQSPMRSESKFWTSFMNQETLFYTGAEKLAKKFDLAVVYAEFLRKKKGIYRFIPTLITDNAPTTKDGEITEKYVQALEESIKRSPRYWLWSHRRWKVQKK